MTKRKRKPDDKRNPEDVTLHEFLSTIFAGCSGEIWMVDIAGNPNGQPGKAWQGRVYDPHHNFDQSKNLYYIISEMKTGATKRQEADFRAMRVVVLDDVGTGKGAKVNPTKVLLRPTYRIETSPGNEQWGFVLDAPLTDKPKAKRLLEATKNAGATDKGGMHIMRAVRLPGGVNGKPEHGSRPYRVRLLEWEPTRLYTPEDLALSFGSDLEGQRGRPRNADLPPLAVDSDPILKLLDGLGVVRERAPNERNFITIACPWSDHHSGTDDTAGYSPGGTFKCFHDHCADRGIADLLAWLREQGCAVDDAIAEMPGPRGGLLRALLRYLYARDVDQFVDREHGTFVKTEALDRFLANEMRGFKPTKVLLEREDLLRVLPVVYLPGKPEVLEMNESGRPILAANTWRVGPIGVAASGNDAALQPYLEHVQWLFPDPTERLIMLDFLTHVVQRRGVKINWMLVALAAMQGTGRDTLLKPVRSILGIRNIATIGASELFSQFNEWEQKELVCFSEADSAEHNRWKVYRELKSKVVMPPDTTHINIKNIRAREQIKVANYIMFTNDPAAVAMDRGDRRVCVVETPHREETVLRYTNTGVFKRLHALFDEPEWMELFHRYLLDRPISEGFDAAGRAPKTAAWSRVFDAARSGLEVYVEESIEEAIGAFKHDLVTLSELLPVVHGAPGLGSTTFHTLASALRRCNAVLLPEFKDGNGKNVRNVWALRDVEIYLTMSKPTLREAWTQRQAKGSASKAGRKF